MALKEKIQNASDDRTDSKYRKALENCLSLNPEIDIAIESLYKSICSNLHYFSFSFEKVCSEIKETFKSKWNFDEGKEETIRNRIEKIKNDLHEDIDRSIVQKKPYTITFQHFIGFFCSACKAYTNSSYFRDWASFKKSLDGSLNELETQNPVFVRKLKGIFPDNKTELFSYIARELFFEDLVKYYRAIDSIDLLQSISGAEDQAIENYDRLKGKIVSLKIELAPVGFFYQLINEEILCDAFLGQNFKYYREGCYVFCSRDDTGKEEISWNWQKS